MFCVVRYFSLVAWLILPFSVLSQSDRYNFSKLNTYNGLSHNQVNAILKDPDGFLWFGTLSGLNRYDGYSFRLFSKKLNDSTSLVDNFVLSLFELPGGKMWVGTRGGPCIYDSYTEKFEVNTNKYLQSLGLPPGPIDKIVKGYDGRYWFLYSNQQLFVYAAQTRVAKSLWQNLSGQPSERITSLKETKDGKLWVVCQNGLLQQLDIGSHAVIFSSNAARKLQTDNDPSNLFIDNDGDIWLWNYTYGACLFHPQDSSIRQFNENSSPARLSSKLVSQVVQDDNGLIWLAADHGGVTLIDKRKNFQAISLQNDPKDPKSISQNAITTMYKDDNGIIWLGTYKQGINFLNAGIVQFPHYHHQESNVNSLPFDDVNRFAEDASGNLWIGTNGAGLFYFDRKNNTYKRYVHDPKNENSIGSNVIVSLWIDHKGILWIGTYFGGLDRFDGKNFTRYRYHPDDPSGLSGNNIWEIYEDREHNLWIGTLGGGLDLLDRKTNRFKHFRSLDGQQGPLRSNYISALLQDKRGNLWIGTTGGIAVFEAGKDTQVFYQRTSERNSLSESNVICFWEDSKGRMWVGTREGLNLFNEQTKKFQVFTTSDGLPANVILNVLEDDRQTLWISTPNGLCNAVPVQKGDSLALSVTSYDETNNLQHLEFNDNAALKTRNGELIFGGPSGFNLIDPARIKKSPKPSTVVFTGLQILNKNVEPGELVNDRVLLPEALSKLQSIDLEYTENVFSVEFASLDFNHSSRDRYAYMLEDFNADWLYADRTQRRATYTNLDPGTYTLKVKVLSRDGVWSDVKSLRINIRPPFWRTNLAYIIYALIAIGLFLLARRITLDRIHMRFEVRQQRREAERAHALEQLKTKFFTNVSHEFRTPLSLIMAPLDRIIKQTADEEQKKQLNLVQRNAKRLLNLVNQLLDFRKMEVQEVALHPAIGDIISFTRDISQSFSDVAEKKKIDFSFTANVDRLEIYFDRDKIEKILFNLLSNAFKYTYDNGAVGVHLLYSPPVASEGDGTLAIEVKDTGIGIPVSQQEKIFERFFQTDVPGTMVNQGTGIGLAITKEFVRLHNGLITVKSEPEKGSCFTVLLPARKIYEPSSRTATQLLATEMEEQLLVEESPARDRKKTIIIIEDNEDLRFYLKDNLLGQYHIEEAINGREGWEKIKRVIPDLVVSDVMMPVMDGIELAKKIRNETLTAHIPVILLTAIGSEEKQLEGLKAGVNDYITKPFTFEILASRIRNLLAQQKLLQKRFQKQIEVNPAEVTITPVDERFLKQALEVVEKYMGEPDFSVEDFSRAMCMSRVALYKKILSLTGKAPLEFIRSIRLKRAAQLLSKSGMNVSEVAYEVGFNNPKNFTKYFKEEFRVLPSQYANQRNA